MDDEMGGECSIYGKNDTLIEHFSWKTLKKEITWKF
jgi:hypothetical protein